MPFLSIIKRALKLTKQPGNKYAKLLSEYKNAFLHMKTYEYVDFLRDFKDSKDLIIETKIDGELTLLVKEGNKAALYSRHGRVRTDTPITDEILKNPHEELWIVGELYALSETGGPQTYAKSMSMLRKPKPGDEKRFRFSAFDLYKIDGEELYDKMSYEERLSALRKVIPKNYKYIHVAPFKKGDINTFKNAWQKTVQKEGWEGLVVYVDDKVYKIKRFFPIDLVVIGVTKNKTHSDQMGALIGAFMLAKNKFLISSKIGTGFIEKDRRDWLKWAKRFKVKEDEKTIWVEPKRIVEVRSEEFLRREEPVLTYTPEGYIKGEKETTVTLRKPVFIRIREDKQLLPSELGRDQVPTWREKTALYIFNTFLKIAIHGPDYMDYDLHKAFELWLNYVNAMQRRKRQPIPFPNFARHIINYSTYFNEGNSYIFGALKDNVFIPTHFAPASLKEGVQLIKELKNRPTIFFVPPDLGDMLERLGYIKVPLVKIKATFRNVPMLKNIYVSSLSLLPVLLKWGLSGIKSLMSQCRIDTSDFTVNPKREFDWGFLSDFERYFAELPEDEIPESFKSHYHELRRLYYPEEYEDSEDYEDYEDYEEPESFNKQAQLEHPNTIIIRKNEFYKTPIKEIDIYNWYKKHAPAILKFLGGRPVMMVIKTDHNFIIKKNEKEGKPIRVSNLEEFDNKLNTGRNVEIHRILSRVEPFGFVDIDPRKDVPFTKTKKVTYDLAKFLKKLPDVKDIKVFFSGNRGFHIYVYWTSPKDVDKARKYLREKLNEFIVENGDDKLTTSLPNKQDMIRLDVTTLHQGGSLRVPYSLHKNTGLASVPISLFKLLSFTPEQARIPISSTVSANVLLSSRIAKIRTSGPPPEGVPKNQFPRKTKKFLRYRQFSPSLCKPNSYWIKKLPNGDEIVMCTRKDTGKVSPQSYMKRRKSSD